MGNFSLLIRYFGISIRGQMAYPVSFLLQTFSQFFLVGMEFLGLVFLFDRFGGIQGFSLSEIALLYGIVHVGFSLADTVATGFHYFSSLIKRGGFDRLLLRPRPTTLQLAGQELTLRRAGRFLQGFFVLSWALWKLPVVWGLARISLLIASILGTACTFFGLFIFQATMVFWTVESLEVMNIVTYGGVEASQYPISIYQDAFKRFFTWVVPLAFMNYFPAVTILSRPNALGLPPWMGWISPLAGLIFLWVALQAWAFGEKHYSSCGG